jgi:LysM repeat protein
MCGYVFLESEMVTVKRSSGPRPLRLSFSLPGLLVLIIALLIINTVMILGWQKRTETKEQVESVQATYTYEATTYVTPTPTVTTTRPPAPPTPTVVPKIEYTVVSGDSCISISTRFDISLDSLLRANEIDCDLLKIGAVLVIPRPTATPEPLLTPGG